MKTKNTTSDHLKNLKAFDRQRVCWNKVSAIISASIALIVFGWNYLVSQHILWAIGCVALIVAIGWWYWTMQLVQQIIKFRMEESQILQSIVEDIKEIKNNLPKDT